VDKSERSGGLKLLSLPSCDLGLCMFSDCPIHHPENAAKSNSSNISTADQDKVEKALAALGMVG